MQLSFWGILAELLLFSIGAGACAGAAMMLLHRGHASRPPIGVFDRSDMLILLIMLLLLPLLYLLFPPLLLTILQALLYTSILSLGLRPLLSRPQRWLVTLFLVGGTLVTAQLAHMPWPGSGMAGTLHWLINDLLLLLSIAIAVNTNVQSGMRLQHVASYGLILAGYDALFAWVLPLTPLLAHHVIGLPFDLFFGFTFGAFQGYLGIGDLFIFTLVACAAYKGYGLRGAKVALLLIFFCGLLLPVYLVPALAGLFGITLQFFPVQVTFGPAAFLFWWWLARQAPERSMAEWLAVHREDHTFSTFADIAHHTAH